MSDFIFVTYEPEDSARAAPIAAALREAGYQVRDEEGIPASGEARAEAVKTLIESAYLVLPLWSTASTDQAENRHIPDEALVAARRGAYLGVLLDKVEPPFGFGGYQTFDLSRWKGGQDKRLAELVDAIHARMKSGPVFVTLRPRADDGGERSRRKPLLFAIGALAVIVAALAWFLLFGVEPKNYKEAVREYIAAVPCAWLQVDPVDDGSTGKLVLTGVADNPARAGETIRSLVRNAQPPITVDATRIARIEATECPAIDAPRKLRRDDGGRLRVISEGVGFNPATNLAQAHIKLSFRPGDRSVALFGVEPSGKVTWILPDFDSLRGLKELDVNYVERENRQHEFLLNADHLGWTGLLLVTGDRPLASNLPQLTVRGSSEFESFLEQATKSGNFQAEMVWYQIQPR